MTGSAVRFVTPGRVELGADRTGYPTRFKHEAAFARCNGTAPLPASSGETVRQRLNRGGDRQVNKRDPRDRGHPFQHHAETRAYLDRRISEGKTKREALRALKRHLSPDLFRRLVTVPLTSLEASLTAEPRLILLRDRSVRQMIEAIAGHIRALPHHEVRIAATRRPGGPASRARDRACAAARAWLSGGSADTAALPDAAQTQSFFSSTSAV